MFEEKPMSLKEYIETYPEKSELILDWERKLKELYGEELENLSTKIS